MSRDNWPAAAFSGRVLHFMLVRQALLLVLVAVVAATMAHALRIDTAVVLVSVLVLNQALSSIQMSKAGRGQAGRIAASS